jgi:hypothetical protein
MKRNHFLVLVLALGLFSASCGSDSRGSGFGTFTVHWQLTAVSGNVPVACSDVDAVTLQLTSTPVGGGAAVIELFDCSDKRGTTGRLPEGSYDVSIELLDSNDVPLNDDTVDAGRHLIIEDTDLDLGVFTFDF